MGFIGKITNPLNHGKDLEDAVNAYNEKIKKCQSRQKLLNEEAIALYELRKEALRRLTALDSYLETLEGCPNSLRLGIKRAVRYADDIQKAWDFETAPEAESIANGNKAEFAVAGAALAGGATAFGGPAAAMAIATTFGTASTGTAISALSGVAAYNAAIAWLGGGALYAGGAGMAGGAAVLGAMGPIGLGIAGIGGIAFIGTSFWKKRKNDDKIKEVKEKSKELDGLLDIIKTYINQVQNIKKKTKEQMAKIAISKLSNAVSDFNQENYPHAILFEMVNDAKNLGKFIKQPVMIS